MSSVGIVWHLRDLRVRNHALRQALQNHDQVIPIYCSLQEYEQKKEPSLWWLNHSLEKLNHSYRQLGTSLFTFDQSPIKALSQLMAKTKAKDLYWNLCFEPALFKLQQEVKKEMEKIGVECHEFNGNHLIDPREITNNAGKPHTVYTPFYKTCLKSLEIRPAQPPSKKTTSPRNLNSTPIPFTKKKWMDKLSKYWQPGEETALAQLKHFTSGPLKEYAKERDFPDRPGTSFLSPRLHFGELSPHEIWQQTEASAPFQRQLLWREFGTYILFHAPNSEKKNWNAKFDRFKWEKNAKLLRQWQQGKTGYPIVDAAMRQLYETGWMHNRLRMIVASFLTKDLLLHWKEGERWFWDTLVDADLANNVLGWQWTAGSGPDAAPYFRVFNPILQSKRFDPKGTFIRKYLPELAELSDQWIHAPFEAPEDQLAQANVTLGKTYPEPIVDHGKARVEALKRFDAIKSG